MRPRPAIVIAAVTLLAFGSALAWQKPFRQYPDIEQHFDPPPPDYREQTEWVFARLMYPATANIFINSNTDWKQGSANWTIDYPHSDRAVAQVLRRLTRVHSRSVEQPVDLDDGDDVYNYPWLYAVEVGHWNLTDSQIAKLREYLLRGGFFMCDDFHGAREWAQFASVMQKVFPDRPIVDIPNDDQIFHVIHDLSNRYQIPGAQYIYSGSRSEYGGYEAHWRGIYDDRGRVMAAICHNMDLGDSWEWADDPRYPNDFSALGMKIAVNYIAYAMTH